jgi:uncharacterized protein (DUF433 family)
MSPPEKKNMERPVRLIHPKEVLFDIRAGMAHSALMEKYNLSAAGLQSLVKKLGMLGVESHPDAIEIIADLKAGMSDIQLMEKYKLSQQALRTLFEHIEKGVLRSRPRNEKSGRGGKVIRGREIVEDICAGKTRWELMEKYELSYGELRQAVSIILRERERIAQQLAEDVKVGMRESDLLEKYQMSKSGLDAALNQLLKEGSVVSADIRDRVSSNGTAQGAESERRDSARRSPGLSVAVQDDKNPDTMGIVRDISEKGLAVRGIEANVGEIKRLAILGDDSGYIDPFELEVECRWVGKDGGDKDPVAGFRITGMSAEGLESLRMFIHLIDLGVSPTWPH